MTLFLFLYLKPILFKLDLKNDFFDISKYCLPIDLKKLGSYHKFRGQDNLYEPK